MHLRSIKGALQVTSSPQSKVYLNDTYIGTTPLCKCEAADMLAVGDYTIKLVPTKGGFSEFQEKITISEAVLTVVDRKFAKDSLSEGSVISLSPLPDKTKSELVVASLPEQSIVLLDDNQLGTTPLSYSNPTESDHVLTIQKNGYKDKTIHIRTPLGYKLTVAAYLSTVDNITATNSASDSAQTVGTSPTPTPTLSGNTVVILDTPTGFLRVRDSASANSTEIGQVKPGETYQYLDEQQGWIQIKLKDGTKGWISSQYTQKQTGTSQ